MLDTVAKRLTARAASLAERVAAWRTPHVPTAAGALPLTAELQLTAAHWRERVAEGHADRFAHRLAWDGLSLDDSVAALREPAPSKREAPPSWLRILDAAAACADADLRDTHRSASGADASPPVPFAEVLHPFVLVARHELAARTPRHHELLTTAAHAALERALLEELSSLGDQTLWAEFRLFMDRRAPVSLAPSPGDSPPAREQYRAFVDALRCGGLLPLLAEYSALARLLATRVEFWVAATAELLRRLARDTGRLRQTFGVEVCMGGVDHVHASLSDSHDRGRRVLILRFACGTQLVYKPRDVSGDEAFQSLLRWCNARTSSLSLATLRVIRRQRYGWIECAVPAACDDAAMVERYYERAGQLLCLAYALGASDLHSENVMACGEHPVLIDLEMLLVAQADPRALITMPDSVLRTNLLPFRFKAAQGRAISDGGFCVLDGSDAARTQPVWVHVNSDSMVRESRPVEGNGRANAPRLQGREVPPAAHDAAIARGFTNMYRLLASSRRILLARDGPWRGFRRASSRVLLRGTDVYYAALRRSLHPRFLRSGLDRGIELETLLRTVLAVPARAPLRDAYRAEQRALLDGDIPRYYMEADGTTLRDAEGSLVEGFRERSGLTESRHRLRRFCAADLAEQRQHICIALARAPHADGIGAGAGVRLHAPAHGGTPLLDVHAAFRAQALEEARRIADAIAAQRLSDESIPTWLTLRPDEGARIRYRFSVTGESLYAGRAGIGFFLAAVAVATGDPVRAQFARAVLAPLVDALQTPRTRGSLTRRIGVHGLRGVAGVAYGLARAAEWLEDATLARAAERAVHEIPLPRDADALELDVMAGVAGTALCLASVADVLRHDGALDRALGCGRVLFERQRAVPGSSSRAWPDARHGRCATGFAHGASGMAAALLRLSTHAARPEFADGAAEAFRYERTLLTAKGESWRRDQESEATPTLCGWCHGATGIGLARVLAHGLLGAEAWAADLARALDATRQAMFTGPDHPCCGAAGRIEFLQSASTLAGHAPTALEAMEYAQRLAERAHAMGSYGLTVPMAYAPTLFQGQAGVGYMWLRLIDPIRFPSLLLLR